MLYLRHSWSLSNRGCSRKMAAKFGLKQYFLNMQTLGTMENENTEGHVDRDIDEFRNIIIGTLVKVEKNHGNVENDSGRK